MAYIPSSSGGNTGTGSGLVRIVWTETVNDADNTSTINAYTQIKRSSSGTTTGTFSGTVTIDGTSKSISEYGSWTTTWQTVGSSYSKTISHNTDGTKSITISTSLTQSGTTMAGTYKTSATVDLTTINRQSTLNPIDDFSINTTDSIPISITKYVNTFTDNLVISIGNTTIKNVSNISDGAEITFSSSEVAAIKNLMSSPQIELTFTLTTLNGATTIGTSTQTAIGSTLDQSVLDSYAKSNTGYKYAINGIVDTTLEDGLQVCGALYVTSLQSSIRFSATTGWKRVAELSRQSFGDMLFVGAGGGYGHILKFECAYYEGFGAIYQHQSCYIKLNGFYFTKARIIYQNYSTAYLELYQYRELEKSVDIRLGSISKGITLYDTDTAGSIPDGYTAVEYTFT